MQNLEKLAIDADLLSIDPSIQNALDVLVDDYQNYARLNDLGKFLVHKGLSKRLGIRLSMEMMSKNIPPFNQDGPIFVVIKVPAEVENLPIGMRERRVTRSRSQTINDLRSELKIS